MLRPSELLKLARDPSLIKGIYEVCDRWCEYCPATRQCLAHRTNSAASTAPDYAPPGARHAHPDDEHKGLHYVVLTSKWLAHAEGRLAPPEIEALLSRDAWRQHRLFNLDDPLERLGHAFMDTAEAYLATRSARTSDTAQADGPTAIAIVDRLYGLAPARIFRALLCAIEAEEGVAGRHEDALAAAKSALVTIDRSLAALERIAAEDDDARVTLLMTQLRQLGPEVERRFPEARAYVRRGLDRLERSGSPSAV